MKKSALPRLLLALLLALITATATAYDFEVDGIYYNINDDGASVSVTRKEAVPDVYSGSVTIPSKVIYEKSSYSVTAISGFAFSYCSGLTSVTIPNSVTSIGDSAFWGCSSLTSVTIPNSVTSIGSCAFYDTPFYNNQPDGVVYFGRVLYDYKGEMPQNTSIVIKEGVVSISDEAFYGLSGLTSVTIPESVTEIGSSAFEGCSSLTSLAIPNSVTEIGGSAFEGCRSLTSLTIPNSVTEIGSYAFSDCSSLTSLTIPNSVTEIGNFAFSRCRSLTSVTIGEGVTKIPAECFYGCHALKEVVIGSNVIFVGEQAFAYCGNITSITVHSPTPPTCLINPSYRFEPFDDEVYEEAYLYVPEESLHAYQEAFCWKDFQNIKVLGNEDVSIEDGAEVAIDGRVLRCGGVRTEVYTLSGAKVFSGNGDVELAAGAYIVVAEGRASKLLVK